MKLNYKRTIFVGFAFFLICAFWQAYDTIIPKILTDKFGLNQTWSGLVMALDNILALFMLPLFGSISDRCRSKRGRRTPFILYGTIFAAALLMILSLADNLQKRQLAAVDISNPTAQETLWEDVEQFTDPDGNVVVMQERFTKEEYASISMKLTSGASNPDYTNYVVPARETYAATATAEHKAPLIIFMAVLMLTLLSMAIFRSPAVALMPDVTMKPLRSKANAVINLMGAAGGIIVLGMGLAFGTGKAQNALMSYVVFFGCIAAIMLVSLAIFMWKVKEPVFVDEMRAESQKYGIDEDAPGDDGSGDRKLSSAERKSLLLILASVVLWFFGYNAVTSKYSIYAGAVLNLDYNLSLMIATGAAIVAYIPVGMVASKIGRKKTILGGIVILGGSFLLASFMRAGSPAAVMNLLFATAGIGWATINVNSYPMVVELSRGGDVGKYTGFYYTASMAAQTATPILSGLLMDYKLTTLFPYATIFVLLAFVTMMFVKHGDSRPQSKKTMEGFGDAD